MRGGRRRGPAKRAPKDIFIPGAKKEPKKLVVAPSHVFGVEVKQVWTASGCHNILLNQVPGLRSHVNYAHDFKIDEDYIFIESEGDLADLLTGIPGPQELIEEITCPKAFTIQDFFVTDTNLKNIQRSRGDRQHHSRQEVEKSHYSPKRIEKIGIDIDCWSDGNNNRRLFFDIIGWYPNQLEIIYIKNKDRKYHLISNQSTKYIEIDSLSGKEKFELWTENITWPLATIEKKFEEAYATISTELGPKELKFFMNRNKDYPQYYRYQNPAKIQYFIETKDWENKTHCYIFKQEIRGEVSLDLTRFGNIIKRRNKKVFAWRFIKIKITNKGKNISLDLEGEDLEEWKKWRIHDWSSHKLILSLEGKKGLELGRDLGLERELEEEMLYCDLLDATRNQITINPLEKLLVEEGELCKNLDTLEALHIILPGRRVIEIAIEERDIIDIKEDGITWRLREEFEPVLERVDEQFFQKGFCSEIVLRLEKMSFKYDEIKKEWVGLLNVNQEEIYQGMGSAGYHYSVEKSLKSKGGVYSTRLDFTFDIKEVNEKYLEKLWEERIFLIEINKQVYLIIKNVKEGDFRIKSNENVGGVKMKYGSIKDADGGRIFVQYHQINSFWKSQYTSSKYVAISNRNSQKGIFWESRNFNRMYQNRKIIEDDGWFSGDESRKEYIYPSDKGVKPQVLVEENKKSTKKKTTTKGKSSTKKEPTPRSTFVRKTSINKKITKSAKKKTAYRSALVDSGRYRKTSANKKETASDIISRVKNNRPKTDSNIETKKKKMKGKRKDKDREHKKLKKRLNDSKQLPQRAQKRAKEKLEDFYRGNPEYRGDKQ